MKKSVNEFKTEFVTSYEKGLKGNKYIEDKKPSKSVEVENPLLKDEDEMEEDWESLQSRPVPTKNFMTNSEFRNAYKKMKKLDSSVAKDFKKFLENKNYTDEQKWEKLELIKSDITEMEQQKQQDEQQEEQYEEQQKQQQKLQKQQEKQQEKQQKQQQKLAEEAQNELERRNKKIKDRETKKRNREIEKQNKKIMKNKIKAKEKYFRDKKKTLKKKYNNELDAMKDELKSEIKNIENQTKIKFSIGGKKRKKKMNKRKYSKRK